MRFCIGKDVLPHEYKGAIYNRESAARLRFISKVFVIVCLVFAARTLQLGLQQSETKRYVGSINKVERRADIVDRNGVVLAKSIISGHIQFFPARVQDKEVDAVAKIVHEIAPADYSIKDALNLIQNKKSWRYIKKNASEEQIAMVKPYNCFEVEAVAVRRYPQRNVFSHIVGFAGKDGGSEGIEKLYDEYLRENKDPLVLSVDSRVQNIFHEQLSKAVDKFHAKGAMGMLMKSSTGEMIAMVQLPDFNPHNGGNVPQSIRTFKLLRDNFEMGSVFKIFNTALAYENGLENRVYDIDKPYMVYDKFNRPALKKPISDVSSFIRDVNKGKIKRRMTAPEIMLHSCNVGSAKIARDLPEGAQKEFFHKLHLDKSLDLDFGKTERAITYKNWGPTEKATAAFGQGISVTPMHLLLAVNAVTNGGIYLYPTILKRGHGAVRGERVLSPEISAKLREIMYGVVEETSGKKAKVEGLEIGGKTGTAEKRTSVGTADKNRNMTVFMGVFPIKTPQYIILVMLDEPQGIPETGGWKTSAWNAVPTAGAILNGISSLLFE